MKAKKQKLVYSLLFASDLALSLQFAKEAGPGQAEQLAAAVDLAAQRLVEFPHLGRPGRVAGTRDWLLPGLPYFISYDVHGDVLEFLALVHFSRQWP